MGAALYVILKLAGIVEHADDWINICRLVSVDMISFVLLLQWWTGRKRSKG